MGSFSGILKKLFGSKSDRDLKQIRPILDKTLAEYEKIDKLSDDQLREYSQNLKKIIADTISVNEAKKKELRGQLEDLTLAPEKKESIATEVDKLTKKIDEQIEEVLLKILPEAFAIMKSTARRFKENAQISVLATDGIFYDFILEGECGVQTANFVGQIPETAEITTVATYPAIVENGTANSVYSNGTLNYELPAEWTYAKDVSNVPMVASFETGAEHMSFKQVGGVMRFPVNNLPAKATFVVKMKGKTITGKFPVDIAQLGTSAMMAGEADSELAIKYSSDVDGASAEFNVPVPVGVYNEFTVVVKDADGAEIYTKEYKKTEDVADNQVNRAVLMMMKEITLPERPMVISEVWPFYVDARVVFGKYEGVSQYAFYVDGSEEPVIKILEIWPELLLVVLLATKQLIK